MIKKIKNYFEQLVLKERDPEKLALSFCVGNYIAFSPFLALHTIMIIVAVWLFNLNPAVTFAVAYGINNPWTAVPIYTLDYLFGYWLLHYAFPIDLTFFTPQCIITAQLWIQKISGIPQLCFWSFMIGGNLVAIITSILLYPVIKKIFVRILAKGQGVYGT